MFDLILAGGGGFFLELRDYILSDQHAGKITSFKLSGYLDDAAQTKPLGTPYLGGVMDYEPGPEDRFLIAIGNVTIREKLYDIMSAKGARFATYVHPSAYVAPSARLADGVIICPGSIVNAEATVQSNTLVNVGCSIGHEASVGRSSVLSPYSAINGCARLGAECFMGTRSTLFPGVTVGENTTVDSHSYVKSDVGKNSIVTLRADYRVVENRLIKRKHQ